MVMIGGNRGGGANFAKPDAGQCVGVLAAVYDIGVQTLSFAGEEKKSQRVALIWELEQQDPDGGPMVMVDSCPVSLFKTSKLREACAALLCRAIDEKEELNTDDLAGKSVMLTLIEKSNGVFIDRRDALQDQSRGLTVQGSYTPNDELHPLVAWHMRQADEGTVPKGQGIAPAPRAAQPKNGKPKTQPQEKPHDAPAGESMSITSGDIGTLGGEDSDVPF